MFKIENFLIESNLKSHFKKNKLVLTCSFIVGLFIGSIPFIHEYKESLKIKQLIEKQKKMQIQKKEKICKDDSSDYKKFLDLGFPKTAAEKFNICMKEQ